MDIVNSPVYKFRYEGQQCNFVVKYERNKYLQLLRVSLEFGEYFQTCGEISNLKEFIVNFFKERNYEIEFVDLE